jgi:hypothetical protein
MLLLLILVCAIAAAAIGGTFSYYYTDSTAFGFDIEPPPIDIDVLYEVTTVWEQGHSGKFHFNFSVTITNNSDYTIEDWYIRFMLLEDELTQVWGADMTNGLPDGQYEIVNPGYNNPATDNIAPGASVTFTGQGDGQGEELPQDVQVGGSNLDPPINVELS